MTFRSPATAAALLLLVACSQPQKSGADHEAITAPTEMVRTTPVADMRVTTGTVRATTSATLAAKVVGSVARVLVSEGDRVRAGDVLVEIDASELRAKAEQARAAARAAEEGIASADAAVAGAAAGAKFADATYDRFAALRERGSVSPHEFGEVAAKRDGARAELERARRGREAALAQRAQALAGVREAEAFAGYTQVRSPIDGIVSARFVDAGAQAAPGVPLVAVEDAREYRVDTTVDEELAARLRAGDAVHVEGVPAQVTHVAPVDSRTRTALVKIALPPSAAFRSGSFVRVAFPIGTRNAITVAPESILRRGELASLFVVDAANVAHMRLITTGEPRNGRLEVLSGLDAGERIVSAAAAVADGARVRSSS